LLEKCADQLHSAHGVLRLVEVYGAALLAEEMEHVTRYLLSSDNDQKRHVDGLDALMRATVQLPTYLERVLSGGRDLALVLLPLLNDSLYGRFMIYTDRIPDGTVHWTIAHGDGPYQTTTATYNYGGMGGLMANYYRDTPTNATDCWQSNQQMFPTGKWTCVVFHFDGQLNKMQFAIDGTDITDVDVDGNSKTDQTCTIKGVDGKWYAPAPFKNISVGWESYQHDSVGAHDAWIDDLILDESPISCPSP